MILQFNSEDIIDLLKKKYRNATINFYAYGNENNTEPYFEVFIQSKAELKEEKERLKKKKGKKK